MKTIAMLGFALAMSPALAAAQQSPPPEAAGSNVPRPNFAAMEQMHAQLEQIHKDARVRVLGALTPAHRSLLAGVVGQLAIAASPDHAAAARTLDNALSAAEKGSVVSIESAAREQSRSLMQSFRTQFEASLTPQERAQMQQRMAAHQAERSQSTERSKPPADPGMELLGLVAGMGGPHGGFEHGRPPMDAPPAR